MRRTVTITLHWLSYVTMLLIMGNGPVPLLGWIFAVSGLAMSVIGLTQGVMNGPGPKLQGAVRAAHPWMSRAMYVLLGLVAGATAWNLQGYAWPGPPLQTLFFILLAASSLHAVFHLWRHTALNDGAFRRITPFFLHGKS